jgi:hypothetical protein
MPEDGSVRLARCLDPSFRPATLRPVKGEFVSFESMQEDKRRQRAEDARRLAEGLVTPRELQDENSIFPLDAIYRIVNLAEYLKKHHSY